MLTPCYVHVHVPVLLDSSGMCSNVPSKSVVLCLQVPLGRGHTKRDSAIQRKKALFDVIVATETAEFSASAFFSSQPFSKR